MAYPQSGFIKIYPSTVSIISGQFALNNDAAPQPTRLVSALQTYYDLRVPNVATAPCLSRNTEKPAASAVYVPLGGDYELSFSPSSLRIEFYNGSYPSAVVATLDFLDADFPMGMMLSQAQLYFNGQVLFGPNRDRDITEINYKYFGSTVETFTPNPGTLLNGLHATTTTSIISNPLVQWSIVQLMKTFGFSIPCDVVVDPSLLIPRGIASEFFILAVYNTQQFTFGTNTPNVSPGGVADLTDASGTLDAFEEDEYKVYWDTRTEEDEEDVNPLFPGWAGGITITRNLYIEITKSIFKFIMPTIVPYGGKRIMITGRGKGTFFVGEFPLQNYNIELVDGSGLYTLTEGQAYDTYYDRSTTPSETVDLKIPDPYVKTGYFNS